MKKKWRVRHEVFSADSYCPYSSWLDATSFRTKFFAGRWALYMTEYWAEKDDSKSKVRARVVPLNDWKK